MTDDACAEMRLLVQADIDGELTPADAARVAAHLAGCAGCAAFQQQLLGLSARLQSELPRHTASASLREAVLARVRADSAPAALQPTARLRWRLRPAPWPRLAVPFGAGFAMAACLMLVVLPRGGAGLPDAIVADHIRALQPGHLMDVVSTDQHTVKPWFDGRIDFAPPVKDLKAEGFPLAGGRLDYVAGHPAAALVYQRRQHIIDLLVWPNAGSANVAPATGSRNGYNYLRWRRDGMELWAISDLNAGELADFVRRWQAD